MSRNGGQASGAALRADCNVIWLPGMAPARSTANSAIPSLTHSGIPGRVRYPAGVMACLAGQAAALPLLTAAGASGDPWAAGAAFGMAAAIASWAGARIAGCFAESAASPSRAAPQDLALHDAFTLALILAASAVLGAGAALLLPAGALLALTIRRMARMRGYSQGDAILLLAAGTAMAGLCRPLGLQECALAGLALAAVAVMKAGHGCLRLPRLANVARLGGIRAFVRRHRSRGTGASRIARVSGPRLGRAVACRRDLRCVCRGSIPNAERYER